MSRIGKLPVTLPENVEVNFDKTGIRVKGPKGEMQLPAHHKIRYEQDGSAIHVQRVDNSKVAKEQHGLRRTLLNNAVQGVSNGFEKGLELVGVGYKVQVEGQRIVLNVGYSNPQHVPLPEDIQARTEGNRLFISGIDKERVGEFAARIRRIRRPEPYKGKGIRYVGEEIQQKAGKSSKK
jgi:large subunit ribosomal protein L6